MLSLYSFEIIFFIVGFFRLSTLALIFAFLLLFILSTVVLLVVQLILVWTHSLISLPKSTEDYSSILLLIYAMTLILVIFEVTFILVSIGKFQDSTAVWHTVLVLTLVELAPAKIPTISIAHTISVVTLVEKSIGPDFDGWTVRFAIFVDLTYEVCSLVRIPSSVPLQATSCNSLLLMPIFKWRKRVAHL